MSFPNSKIFLCTFFIGLLTFMFSMVAYFNAYPRNIERMNYTTANPIDYSTLPMPLSTSLGLESQYNCLTSDCTNFLQQYEKVNNKEVSQLCTSISDAAVDVAHEMFEGNHTGSDYYKIENSKINDDNLLKFNNKIQKMISVYQNFFSLQVNSKIRKELLNIEPIIKLKNIQEIAKPALCIVHKMSNEYKAEIDIKDDARYFFEFQLIEFLKKYIDEYQRFHSMIFQLPKLDLICDEPICNCFIFLFKSLYKFSNEPMYLIHSSHYGDLHNIVIENSINKIRSITIENEDKIKTERFSNVYEYDSKALTGENITLFDFSFKKIFKAETFKTLNIDDYSELKKELIEILNNITEKIKIEIIQRLNSGDLDLNNEIVILLPSKREFLQLALIDNYNNLYDRTIGIYLYKYEPIKKNNVMLKDALFHTKNIQNIIDMLLKPEEFKKFSLYKEFNRFYDEMAENLKKFLGDEINHNIFKARAMIRKTRN